MECPAGDVADGAGYQPGMGVLGDLRNLRALRGAISDPRAAASNPLISEFRASLNNPAVALSSDSIIAVLGSGLRTDSGVNVSELTAMRMTAVWRCVSLMSGLVAQLPLKTYGILSGGGRAELELPILKSPYPGMTSYQMWELVMVHLLLWGNAYLLKIYDELGQNVVRLLPLNPWSVYVRRNTPIPGSAFGSKVFAVSGADHTYTDEDILHIPGVGYDGIQGLSPIAHARQGIGLGLAAEEYGARLFGSGSLHSGFLKTDQRLTQEGADVIKQRWRERIAGLGKAHEVAVLDNGLSFVPITIPPDQAQFLQTRAFTVEEICRLYGVPPHLVMQTDKTSSWGAGIAEQTLGFVRFTLSAWTTRLEQELTLHLCPPGQYLEFDMRRLLRGDDANRYSVYATAKAIGVMTGNEIRKAENMPPGGPELDVFNTAPLTAPAAPGVPPDGGKPLKGL